MSQFELNTTEKTIAEVQSIVHEMIDLLTVGLEYQFSKDSIFLQFETGEEMQITVKEEHYSQIGIHRRGIEDLDEYELFDLVERALRDGFPVVYIHPTKAA